MRTELKLLGVANRPVDIGDGIKMNRWYYIYFAVGENGLVDTIEDEDYVEDGIYDIDYFEDTEPRRTVNENDLLGSTASQRGGSLTKREVCEIASRCWA